MEKDLNALLKDEYGNTQSLLLQGFEAFNQATLKLQAYYQGLEEKVDELNQKLAQKNQELEQNLIEKERVKNYLSNIFESSAIGIIVTDMDGVITSVNQKGLQITLQELDQAQGAHLNDFLQASVLSWNLSFSQLQTYEKPQEIEIEYIRSDQQILQLRLFISLMYSEQGNILGLIVNTQDITHLKRLEADAERKNRLTTMGEMAVTIAHEIRNPLGSIELFSGLLRKDNQDESQLKLLDHVSSAIKNMNHIITNLLGYTKPRSVMKERIHFHEFLTELIHYSHHLIGQSHISISTEFEADFSEIYGDEELLKQVFNNLFLNASQAMISSGTLVISTRNLSLEDPKLLKRFESLPQHLNRQFPLFEVQVRDTGEGMPSEVQKRIFDPFYSTKERGMGLGLVIVHNIIESHDGIIDVESKEAEGTIFSLTFPSATTY